MENLKNIYSNRKLHYNTLCEKQNACMKLMSRIRLFVFILGLLSTVVLYRYKYIYLSISSFAVFLTLFIIAVKLHSKLRNNFKFTKRLVHINEVSIERCMGKWVYFKDNGKEFKDSAHNYSSDLDVFGEESIFQWINTGETDLGREKLAKLLCCKNHKTENIFARQNAIKELSHKINFRQRFQAEAYFTRNDNEKYNIKNLIDMLNVSESSIYSNKFVIVLFKIIPCIIILLLFMTFVMKLFKNYVAYIAILFPMILLLIDSKNRSQSLDILFKLKESLKSYKNIIDIMYREKFSSDYIDKIQNVFKNDLQYKNKKKIKKIEFKPMKDLLKIADNISERRNMAYIVLNILFLWDYQCMFSLEKWKKNYSNILKWLDAIAEMEVLCSLSIINFDHPEWTIPKILNRPLTIRAKSLAHPLIRGNAVCNDLNIDKNSKVLLITGSNMSGKSTFLRTVGVNLILAYSGTAVRADYFCCSIMNIYTCMRINDNLDKNISSFYGEILRIKSIVEAAKKGENIFFLLDEIFKGTNSVDRHIGAKILIKKLKSLNTCGMVSTHDLELCDMENKNSSDIKNYYFREYYKSNKIYFDYKLHRGVSKTRNALYLMKMAGIDIPECDNFH